MQLLTLLQYETTQIHNLDGHNGDKRWGRITLETETHARHKQTVVLLGRPRMHRDKVAGGNSHRSITQERKPEKGLCSVQKALGLNRIEAEIGCKEKNVQQANSLEVIQLCNGMIVMCKTSVKDETVLAGTQETTNTLLKANFYQLLKVHRQEADSRSFLLPLRRTIN